MNDQEVIGSLLGKLYEFQFSCHEDFENTKKEAKASLAFLRKQINDYKKLQKKGNRRRIPLPSLEAIREEEAKGDGDKNRVTRRTAAAKALEVTDTSKTKVRKGRSNKRKSSSSPSGQPAKNRKEETHIAFDGNGDDKELHDSASSKSPQISEKTSSEIKGTLVKETTPLTHRTSARKRSGSKALDCPENKEFAAVKRHHPEEKIVTISSSEDESSPEKPSPKLKIVKKDEVISNGQSYQPTSSSSGAKSSCEKKSTQSKMPNEKANADIGDTRVFSENESSPEKPKAHSTLLKKDEVKGPSNQPTSSSSEAESPCEKRATQSKIPKETPNADVENARIPTTPESDDPPENRPSQFKAPKTIEVNASDQRNQPQASIAAPSSERRCTRSKMAKPKEKVENVINDKMFSPSSDEVSSPEKRSTRSKMTKPKQKLEAESTREHPLSSDEQIPPSPEKRCTRSKMVKPKQKTEVVNAGTSDDSSEEKEDCTDSQEENHNPKKKINTKGMFTPGCQKDLEKENHFSSAFKSTVKKPGVKYTPLQSRNAYVTTPAGTSKIPIVSSALKSKTALEDAERRKKEEEARKKRKKEEEVIRKRQEMVKAKQIDIRKKNEEKMKKTAATRREAEKEKSEHLMRLEKEKEERERIAKEQLERRKEEETTRKKLAHLAKAQEAESRRLKEEQARLAKLREMEEEQKQQEELRLKQQEETERIQKQRMEEMRLKEAALKSAMQKKKLNIIPLKDKENLDINDFASDDEDEYETSHPKKEWPQWARSKEERIRQDRIDSLVPIDVVLKYYAIPSMTPDLTEIFGKMTMKRVRSSSAVWLDTPPLQK